MRNAYAHALRRRRTEQELRKRQALAVATLASDCERGERVVGDVMPLLNELLCLVRAGVHARVKYVRATAPRRVSGPRRVAYGRVRRPRRQARAASSSRRRACRDPGDGSPGEPAQDHEAVG
jgi:hypothetical protein